MPFNTMLQLALLNDRNVYPWITLAPLEYESALTGETYVVPKHFRTDGASIPTALMLLPHVGAMMAMRFMGQGVWKGFRAGVVHDFLRRLDRTTGEPPVPAKVAHLVFREALTEDNYSADLVNAYYAAVVAFNS